ncbi:hypothetical protein [Lutimonas sp.]|uniref:hypothetical protein n=1 Tax=Lutimonas sp. TaxID=1872403 RepID=UPI003D9ACCC3
MKITNYIFLLFIGLSMLACSDDTDGGPEDLDKEIEDLIKVQQISNDDHIIEVYNSTGTFYQGYNELTIRIVDKATETFISNATLNWQPMMHMTEMMHSCPASDLKKVSGMKTIYDGFIVFQMPGNSEEGWTLSFTYSVDGMDYMAKDDINVIASEERVVAVFNGTDQARYVLALMEPLNPDVKINDISAGLYKMENMMTFTPVADYTVALDPRMPSMGNHTSPNNQDLVYDAVDQIYKGKLSLTMTGYWMLNLKLLNENDEVLKGEDVTEENESSSLYFEIEF